MTQTTLRDRGYGLEDFRFSGSYASRYMNCHGSAVLEETLPGFTAKQTNKIDTTPKGTIKAHVFGTRLHTIFEDILLQTEDWLEAAILLDELADVRGPKRTDLITDEKNYITWWFLAHHTLPPIEYSVINQLWIEVGEQQYYDDLADEEIIIPATAAGFAPKQIRFLAEAVRFVFNLIDNREGATWRLEPKVSATWTATQPKTTADMVITDGKTLDIIDLKLGTLPVPAFENYQLLYYARTYKTTETEQYVHILQAGAFDSWEVTNEYLDEWTQQALEAEDAILKGSRSLSPGDHCLFCPANPYSKGERGTPVCPAQTEVLFGPEDLTIITDED